MKKNQLISYFTVTAYAGAGYIAALGLENSFPHMETFFRHGELTAAFGASSGLIVGLSADLVFKGPYLRSLIGSLD